MDDPMRCTTPGDLAYEACQRENDRFRAELAALRERLASIARVMCGKDEFPGDLAVYVGNVVDNLNYAERRVESLRKELACPVCGCADQIDAESGECGCDSLVCARDGGVTLAAAYVAVHERLTAACSVIKAQGAIADELRARAVAAESALAASQARVKVLEETLRNVRVVTTDDEILAQRAMIRAALTPNEGDPDE